MQIDFHYYAACCAALLAGYPHEEAVLFAYSDQFTDCCSRILLRSVGAPLNAATTQLQMELMDVSTDLLGLQDITRIWASFHFLPRDLYAFPPFEAGKPYRDKYRLICGPNGELAAETVKLAKGRGLEAAGLAMHVVADTWAHQYFAGTPSMVINNVGNDLVELVPAGEGAPEGEYKEKDVHFKHSPGSKDDLDKHEYNSTIYQISESTVMNLGHGRAGHLPDYSFMRYRYMPAWADYTIVTKDNPSDYYHAFCQMIHALKFLRGEAESFETDYYDFETAAPYKERIHEILTHRRMDASEDWKALGEEISGQEIPPFDESRYLEEYKQADEDCKDDTFLGRYILAALAQKSMVTKKIFESGSLLAGISVDYRIQGFQGIRDFLKLVEAAERRGRK